MPAKHKQAKVTLSEKEETRLLKEADKRDLTLSNLIRDKIGLPVLTRGAQKGNKFAVGNRGRWANMGGEKTR